jgi:hypothetical protein
MLRRSLGASAVVAALLSAGVVPLATAHAAACPMWTDVTGDSHPNQNAKLPADPSLDIVGATLATGDGKVVARITLASLAATASNTGDEIGIEFTLGGKAFILYADRDAKTTDAGFYNNTDSKSGAATVAYDVAKHTVTLTGTVADLSTALGSPAAGKTMSGLTAYASNQFQGVALLAYDDAPAPNGATYVVGEACDGGGPTAVPAPAAPGLPVAGCNTIADGKNDGTPSVATANGSPVGTANDPDLDITGVAFETTATDIFVHLRIDKLAAKPATFEGHAFYGGFTVNSKPVLIEAAQTTGATQAVLESGVFAAYPYVVVSGSRNASVRASVTYDTARSMVVLGVDRTTLGSAVGAPLTDGTVLTATLGKSYAVTPTGGTLGADTAQATAAADQKYTVGVSPCFGPLPAKLTNAGVTKVQYTDAAAFAVKITNSTGKALSGKSVTFAVGSATATGVSGSDGVARASLDPKREAGAYEVVASFAGDTVAAKAEITTPFTVVVEATRITLSVAKKGSKRTVTAKLADDDGQPLAGQVVTFLVDGKKAGTATTNASGVATFAAKAGQTVVADFAAVTGKYAAAKATGKA